VAGEHSTTEPPVLLGKISSLIELITAHVLNFNILVVFWGWLSCLVDKIQSNNISILDVERF
jgi:hypothetical protein